MWENFFKPEIRASGHKYFVKGLRLSQPSDTEIQVQILCSPPVKVFLKSDTVGSSILKVSCSCPHARKARLCKHVWAGLLEVVKSKPEFLEDKAQIEVVPAPGAKSPQTSQTQNADRVAPSSQQEQQKNFKARQGEYRKSQYQKQRARLKEQQRDKKARSQQPTPTYPEAVQRALNYFTANGFPMTYPLQAADVGIAKKKLSRVFHPDIGGLPSEILELNQNCEVLLAYLA